MSRLNRPSAATEAALRAVAKGMPKSEAARKFKVARSTIDRAIQRRDAAFLEYNAFPDRNPPV